MIIYKERKYCKLGRFYHYDGLQKVSKLEGLVLCGLYGYKFIKIKH